MRIGHGYDVHRFAPERKLILGGVEIKHEMGLLGHSDADVLTHALMDAMLGAASLGDIGLHFPDNDDTYKGISSVILLEKVKEIIGDKGYVLSNADITVVAQSPKLRPYIDNMRECLAKALECDVDCINIKATTEEKLGFTGRKEGIAAHAVVLLDGIKR
ncbi:MAG: 2-C-methyl-D-erythritol 2,4-cyclodiphosphate synthase [Ruminococcaceae bacterium]|nr:2-C-methyl-D-erythritol 2,4-cyclodiphosphate synthase [Oscillospiraceae bacterium]